MRKQDLPSTFMHVEGLRWFKGKLYVIGHWQVLEIVKEKQHGSNDTTPNGDGEAVLKVVSTFAINNIADSSIGRVSYCYGPDKHIVESDDELFMVVRYYRNDARKEVIDLQVYKMDFNSMRWEELHTLGDHVLFLDSEGRTTFSGSARELGLIKGCVFFTLHNDKVLYTFNIEDGSISFSLPCPNLPTPWLTPTWMSINNGKCAEKHIFIGAVEEIETTINEEEVSENNNEEKTMTTWGSLSLDILEMISGYLNPLDYLHFRVVCKANRLATTAKMVQSTSLPPWMIFHRKKDAAIYSFVEPIYNDNFFMDFQELFLGSTIRYSKGGWLLMTKEMTTIFFFNPFTREVIHLPDLPNGDYFLSGMCFSKLPTSSDCEVMGIGEWHKNSSWIVTISRGNDSWNHNEDHKNTTHLPLEDIDKNFEFRPWKNNPVFHKAHVWCLDSRGMVGAWRTQSDYLWTVLNKPSRPCNSVYQNFLVECDEELLGVFIGQFRSYVKVFKLLLHEKVWVEVKNLGNHMLFISNTSTHSAIAPNSRMGNKIYFPRFHGEEIVYYSLDTHKYHTCGSDQHYSGIDFCNTKEQLHCSWIEPNWSKSTAQELDWCLSQVTEDD